MLLNTCFYVAAAARCDTAAFVAWARQGGATISPDVTLEPPPFSASSLGVFARGSLAPGATVARVPYSLLFSPLWCHHSPDAKAAIALVAATLGRAGDTRGGVPLNPTEESALLLAFETAAGGASYWAPWIRCLPTPAALETPTVWREAELDELQRSPLRGWVEERRVAMRRSRQRIRAAVATRGAAWRAAWPPLEQVLSATRWEWALSMVFTRGFSVPWGGQGRSVPALVPFGGMLNFDPTGHNVVSSTRASPTERKYSYFDFSVVGAGAAGAARVAAGAELKAQYGAGKASTELLLDYGFAYADNAADYVVFPLGELLVPFLEDARRRGARASAPSGLDDSPLSAVELAALRDARGAWRIPHMQVVLQRAAVGGAPNFALAKDLLLVARVVSRTGLWAASGPRSGAGAEARCAADADPAAPACGTRVDADGDADGDAYEDEDDELGGMGLRYRLRHDAASAAEVAQPLRRAAEEGAALRMAADMLAWAAQRYGTTRGEDAAALRRERDAGAGFGRLANALIVRMSEKELLRAFAAKYRARAVALGVGAKAQSGVVYE